MRHPPVWLVILFAPVLLLAVLGLFRLLLPVLNVMPLFPSAKPLIGFGWALFLLLWLLLVHSCARGEDSWNSVWATMAWAIVGTLFINEMCVWASSHGKVSNKDIDGIVAGASISYFISTLLLGNWRQASLERKAKSDKDWNIKGTPKGKPHRHEK